MGGLDNVPAAIQLSIGIVVGLLSTSIQSLGLTLQRKSHIIDDGLPHSSRKPPHRRRMWQTGMLLFIVSNILGSSVQITTLPLVILSPLQASGLVFNSIFATLILSEPFTRLSLIGTVLVCIGAALIAAFGAMREPVHSLDQLLKLLAERPFVLWMVGQALLVMAILAGVRASLILQPRLEHAPRARMIRGVAYGSISGILSAHCLLLAKSAVELLVRTIIDRVNQFNRWQSWMILVGLVALALTQLYYLHRGLKLCSTSVLYPLVFCIYNIIAILDGLIYYKQASRLSVLYGCLIALGTFILLSGVLALSWRLNDEESTTKHSEISHARSILSPGIAIRDSSLPPMEDTETEAEYESEGYEDENTSLLRRSHTMPDADKIKPRQRGRAVSEVEEIWGELEDALSPMTPKIDFGGGSEEARAEPAPDENTSLLGSERRPKLGRSYTTPNPKRNSANLSLSRSVRRSQRRPKLQNAIGGWWRMKWWKRDSNGLEAAQAEREARSGEDVEGGERPHEEVIDYQQDTEGESGLAGAGTMR